MMDVDIKINGIMIGHLYLHNKGSAPYDHMDLPTTLCEYYWEYYSPKASEFNHVIVGEINHDRLHGAEILVRDILDLVIERKAAQRRQ